METFGNPEEWRNFTDNAIVNGGMSVWQRGTSFTTVNGRTADGWAYYGDPGTTCATSLPDFATNKGTWYAMTIGSVGSTDTAVLYQRIEGLHYFSGQTVTFSMDFDYPTTLTVDKVFVKIEGYYGTGGGTGQGVSSYIDFSTPGRKYFTVTLPEFDNTYGSNPHLFLGLYFAADSTDVAGQTGTIWIRNLKLEINPYMTGFLMTQNQYELDRCSRYFTKGVFLGGGATVITTTGVYSARQRFRRRMYAVPTVTISGYQLYFSGTGWASPAPLTSTVVDEDGFAVAHARASDTVGKAYLENGTWTAEAEIPA